MREKHKMIMEVKDGGGTRGDGKAEPVLNDDQRMVWKQQRFVTVKPVVGEKKV